MLLKRHITQDKRLMLALCDNELVGKAFSEGEKQLDLANDFYRGTECAEESAILLVLKAFSVNAVGKKSVACCIKAGVATEQDVMRIAGVPYLHIISI